MNDQEPQLSYRNQLSKRAIKRLDEVAKECANIIGGLMNSSEPEAVIDPPELQPIESDDEQAQE